MARKRRLTKKQKQQLNHWVLGLMITALIFIMGYFAGQRRIDFEQMRVKLDEAVAHLDESIRNFDLPHLNKDREELAGTTQIHVFDVGQGSSILYIAKDGSTVLVDTGRFDDGEKRIISYLDQHIGLGESIDLLIFSHNDADHIGHGDLVLQYFDVQEVWMNGMDHTSSVYLNLLDTLGEQDVLYAEPKAGETLMRGAFDIQVLHPSINSPKKDNNDESLVTRISFDGLSVMTSGDASEKQERDIIQRNGNLKSDILILGHHGAKDSASQEWLEAIQPQMAFYQAGSGNSYGHPHEEVLLRLENLELPYYGTDELGTISIYIDAENHVTVETEK